MHVPTSFLLMYSVWNVCVILEQAEAASSSKFQTVNSTFSPVLNVVSFFFFFFSIRAFPNVASDKEKGDLVVTRLLLLSVSLSVRLENKTR